MSFLNIAGIDVEIQTSGASRGAPTVVGERVRTFSGALRSTKRAEKRTWSFTTGPLTPAQLAELESAILNDTVVPILGDAVGGELVLCMVDIKGVTYHQDKSQVTDFLQTAQLELSEA